VASGFFGKFMDLWCWYLAKWQADVYTERRLADWLQFRCFSPVPTVLFRYINYK
jgi:hypothetical protein